jgi:pimeloyl-ACP methyl ester carboxylesterase
MDGSLNPADAAESIRAIPQLHLIGAGDTVVPELIGRSYLARMTDTRCARLRQVGGVAHNQGWEAVWKTEVSKIPAC